MNTTATLKVARLAFMNTPMPKHELLCCGTGDKILTIKKESDQ